MENNEKELQNMVANYRFLESRLEALIRQRDVVMAKLAELKSALESLSEMGKSREVLFSLGSDTFVSGKVVDKKNILVDVGAGVLLEKNIEESMSAPDKKRVEVEKAVQGIQNDIMNISSLLEQLNFEMQKAYQKVS